MKLLTRKCPEAKASKYEVTLYVSDNDHFMKGQREPKLLT